MDVSESIKPISYLKENVSEIIQDIQKNHKTLILTENGDAKLVIQDIKSYKEMKDSIALLKILALSADDIKKGNITPAEEAFKNIEDQLRKIKQ
ncbi:MAG TPA: type II toxin-antitoxin system Phd/YefM family antitoxin [Chitinispirillaceae bacterium]|nr:type II toxin-antitoxin system Phd/YefM family antitoxin [Chitinispirillaceae bacterium]